jgi:hypothetical protein
MLAFNRLDSIATIFHRKPATVQSPEQLLASKAQYVHVKYPHGEMLRLFDPTSPLAENIKGRTGLEICVPPSSGQGQEGATSQRDKVMGLLEALSGSSTLQQLRLIFISEAMDLPKSGYLAGTNTFARLTHISILGGSPALYDCITVLTQCTSAVQAEFGTVAVPSYDANPSNYTIIDRTCLPQLRSLTLIASSDVEAFLPHFECPGLLRLLISNGPIDLTGDIPNHLSNCHFPALQEFISSSPKLKQVVIVNNIRWKYAKRYLSPQHCRALWDVPVVDIRLQLPRRRSEQDAELPSGDGSQFRVCRHHEQAWAHVKKGATGKLVDLKQNSAPFWDESNDTLEREWMVFGCSENETT